jgi:hypothetical protein
MKGCAVPAHEDFLPIAFDRHRDAFRVAAALRAIDDPGVFDIWVEKTGSVGTVWVPRKVVRAQEGRVRAIVASFGHPVAVEELL